MMIDYDDYEEEKSDYYDDNPFAGFGEGWEPELEKKASIIEEEE